MFYAILGTMYVVCVAALAIVLVNLKPLGTARGASGAGRRERDTAAPARGASEFATHP
jgi:hypothetical protein